MTYTTATITSPTPAKDLMAALNAPLTASGFTFVETYGTPPNASWSAVCSGGGQYVAVASGTATAATSPDGITWTQRMLPATAAWSAITYGGGLFVTVATSTSNLAATSPDGITWTLRTLPTLVSWTAVTYGGGQFVAIASGGTAATSPDGITWTQRGMASNTTFDAVIYAGGQFVAVAQAAIVNTSPDGITWTSRTAASNLMSAIASNGSMFVTVHGVGGNLNVASSSPDGITWTARTLPASQSWTGVAYGAGVFVAVANTLNGVAATSPDGITWTQRILPASTAGYLAVTYSNGLFVAVGASGVSAATSPDGITWTTRTMSATSTSPIADVYKSPAAANQFGQDWYLILKRQGDYGTQLFYQVAEGYNAGTHRASSYGGQGVSVIPVAGSAANPLVPVAPELAHAVNAVVTLTSAVPFTYWVSASANRVVLGVKTNIEQGFYAGLYDDLLPAGVTGFPLVCAPIPTVQTTPSAIGGNSATGTGGFTREPGQALASTLNFEAKIHNGYNLVTATALAGNFTPTTDAYAVYGNVFSVSRVLVGSARGNTTTNNIANSVRGLLIGCVSSAALTVIGDTVTSGGKTYARMGGPNSSYGVFADTAL